MMRDLIEKGMKEIRNFNVEKERFVAAEMKTKQKKREKILLSV